MPLDEKELFGEESEGDADAPRGAPMEGLVNDDAPVDAEDAPMEDLVDEDPDGDPDNHRPHNVQFAWPTSSEEWREKYGEIGGQVFSCVGAIQYRPLTDYPQSIKVECKACTGNATYTYRSQNPHSFMKHCEKYHARGFAGLQSVSDMFAAAPPPRPALMLDPDEATPKVPMMFKQPVKVDKILQKAYNKKKHAKVVPHDVQDADVRDFIVALMDLEVLGDNFMHTTKEGRHLLYAKEQKDREKLEKALERRVVSLWSFVELDRLVRKPDGDLSADDFTMLSSCLRIYPREGINKCDAFRDRVEMYKAKFRWCTWRSNKGYGGSAEQCLADFVNGTTDDDGDNAMKGLAMALTQKLVSRRRTGIPGRTTRQPSQAPFRFGG